MSEDETARINQIMTELGISEDAARWMLDHPEAFQGDVIDGIPLDEKQTIIDLLPKKFPTRT